MPPNPVIRDLAKGVEIEEAHGRKRKGRVTSVDLDSGHVMALIHIPPIDKPRTHYDRPTFTPSFTTCGPTPIKITIRDFIQGAWKIATTKGQAQ